MKEEWLMAGAVVPVDVETTAALVAEIKRLIDVVGGMASAQPAQEPEAWMHPDGRLWLFGRGYDKSTFTIPLYATPPQRPWVGLTDDEIKAMDTGTISNASFYAGALWADAKLKEMNKP